MFSCKVRKVRDFEKLSRILNPDARQQKPLYGSWPATLGLSTSVADPDPGSGAFFTPGSGIRNRFFPDPGSQIHIFESLVTIFWVKRSIILWKLAQIFSHFKTNVYLGAACLPLNVVENQTTVGRLCRLVIGNATGHSWRTSVNSATKERHFRTSTVATNKQRIRDKHPGSATLLSTNS